MMFRSELQGTLEQSTCLLSTRSSCGTKLEATSCYWYAWCERIGVLQDIMEVIDSIWDAFEDHKNVTEKVASAWREEAMVQQSIVEECAAAETLERMLTLQVCSTGSAFFCTLCATVWDQQFSLCQRTLAV